MTGQDIADPLYYRSHVFCCTNVRAPGHTKGCCHDRDGTDLRTYMKAKVRQLKLERVRINASGCLDRCEHGPVMVIYPEGVWYSCKTRSDVDEIIETHLRGGKEVPRLKLPPADSQS